VIVESKSGKQYYQWHIFIYIVLYEKGKRGIDLKNKSGRKNCLFSFTALLYQIL
jgi:hypothetical protein